jgi:hypothetical protein
MPPPAPHPAPTGRDRTPGEPEAGPGAAFFVGQAGASRRKYVEPPGEERASDQAGKLEELASLTREIWSTMEMRSRER